MKPMTIATKRLDEIIEMIEQVKRHAPTVSRYEQGRAVASVATELDAIIDALKAIQDDTTPTATATRKTGK